MAVGWTERRWDRRLVAQPRPRQHINKVHPQRAVTGPQAPHIAVKLWAKQAAKDPDATQVLWNVPNCYHKLPEKQVA